MEKRIKIRIISKQTEATDDLFPDIPSLEDEDFAEGIMSEITDCDTMELRTEGTLRINGGKAEITYEESEITGMEGSVTKISFDTANPSLISMIRDGTVTTAMVFETGMRHICVYETPIMPFELCVDTISVKNELLTLGTLSLDYMLEIKGGDAGRTSFRMQIKDAKSSAVPLGEYT